MLGNACAACGSHSNGFHGECIVSVRQTGGAILDGSPFRVGLIAFNLLQNQRGTGRLVRCEAFTKRIARASVCVILLKLKASPFISRTFTIDSLLILSLSNMADASNTG